VTATDTNYDFNKLIINGYSFNCFNNVKFVERKKCFFFNFYFKVFMWLPILRTPWTVPPGKIIKKPMQDVEAPTYDAKGQATG